MPIIDRNYFAAAQQGRDARQAEQITALRRQSMQQEVDQTGKVNALLNDPSTTPEGFARAGRSDIANSLVNIDSGKQEKAREFAKQMQLAAQYGLQEKAPKAFIEKNFPLLVETYGPSWASATDEDVKRGLQDAAAKFGVQAGAAPTEQFEQVSGPRGSLYNRSKMSGEAKQLIGPDNTETSGVKAPAGYKFNADGTLSPILGGPADPNTPNTKDDSRIFAKADKLRDEFNAQSKEFITVNDAYNTVKTVAADHSAAGDLSMIFAFMKMLDPNSVVREQEFANAQNAAGVPQRIANTYNKLLSGERLSETQRQDFINQANNLYKSKSGRQNSIVKRYTDIAKRNRVNPDDVVGDLSVALGGDQGQSESTQKLTPEQAAKLPPGTKFIGMDGVPRVKN